MIYLDGMLMECEVSETPSGLVIKLSDRRYFEHLDEIRIRRCPVSVRTSAGSRLMILSSMTTWRTTGSLTAHFRPLTTADS